LRWPDELIERVDAVRGELSRSEFIRRCVLNVLIDKEPDPIPTVAQSQRAAERALRAQVPASVPAPTPPRPDPATCAHRESKLVGDVRYCACGATRAVNKFSWTLPE
jgi:hypothetical protein